MTRFMQNMDEASPSLWKAICRYVQPLDGHTLAEVLAYTIHHTEHWPSKIRTTPDYLIDQVKAADPTAFDDPRWTLVRNLNLNMVGLDTEKLQALTQSNYLSQVRTASLMANAISSVRPLQHLTKLQELNLWGNDITDITPFEKLPDLHWLYVKSNPITDSSTITTLRDRGVRVYY